VPTLGLQWYAFAPFVYLPMWEAGPDPRPQAAFGSVTHWSWGGELPWRGRLISNSKRDAYLRYIELPEKTRRPFQLAVDIPPEDRTGDRELLESHGWTLVDPYQVADSPLSYQKFIDSCRAEISCAKAVYTELNTGWLSDRSVCYLASGRPVLAEETGVSDYLPTGNGLLTFRDMSEAVAGVAEIDSNYEHHRKAARKLAEEYFSSEICLGKMLSACGYSGGNIC
jgi:hypothetical protein